MIWNPLNGASSSFRKNVTKPRRWRNFIAWESVTVTEACLRGCHDIDCALFSTFVQYSKHVLLDAVAITMHIASPAKNQKSQGCRKEHAYTTNDRRKHRRASFKPWPPILQTKASRRPNEVRLSMRAGTYSMRTFHM